MFAVSNSKKGIDFQELQSSDPHTRRGLTDIERHERQRAKILLQWSKNNYTHSCNETRRHPGNEENFPRHQDRYQ